MDSSRGIASSKSVPKAFLVRLGVGALILNLFVILMAATALRNSWRNHQDRTSATTANLALVLDRYVADTFNKADLAVLAVKDEAERPVADPKSGSGDLDAFIRRQLERMPGLLALRTTDAQGTIIHGRGLEAAPAVNLMDREHFIRLRDEPGVGPVISKPLVGRLTGTWVIILARRIERPDHGFAGMAHAVIALDQFSKAFSALDVGPHGSLALRDLDMGLIARYPEPVGAGTAIGQKVVSRDFQAFVASGQNAGTYRARTPFDQIKRTFAIRKVSDQPFYLAVGLAEQDFLAGWWREVRQECLEVGLFTCLTLVASWLIRRTWLRQQAARENLAQALAEVKTLGGMLPICSHCKKIRDDKGYWNQLEAYLNEHIDAEFTHGICPDCAREAFPQTTGKRTTL